MCVFLYMNVYIIYSQSASIAKSLKPCPSVCLSICLFLCVCLSARLFICLPVLFCFSVFFSMSVCLSVFLLVYLLYCSYVCLPVCLPVCSPVYLSIYLSVHLSVGLSACLFTYVCLFVCFSVHPLLYLSGCLSVCSFASLPVRLSLLPSVCRSVCPLKQDILVIITVKDAKFGMKIYLKLQMPRLPPRQSLNFPFQLKTAYKIYRLFELSRHIHLVLYNINMQLSFKLQFNWTTKHSSYSSQVCKSEKAIDSSVAKFCISLE